MHIARNVLLLAVALAAAGCSGGEKPHPMYTESPTPAVQVTFGSSPVPSDPPPPEEVRLLIRCFVQRVEAGDRTGLAQLATASESDAKEAVRIVKSYGKAAHGSVVAHIGDEDPKDSRGGYLEFTDTGQRMTVELEHAQNTWRIDLFAAKEYR